MCLCVWERRKYEETNSVNAFPSQTPSVLKRALLTSKASSFLFSDIVTLWALWLACIALHTLPQKEWWSKERNANKLQKAVRISSTQSWMHLYHNTISHVQPGKSLALNQEHAGFLHSDYTWHNFSFHLVNNILKKLFFSIKLLCLLDFFKWT